MSSSHTLADKGVYEPAREERTHRAKRRITDYIPYCFVLSLLIPYRVTLGPLLLSPDRIFLLLMLIPCLFTIISGRFGRILPADILIFSYTAWTALTLFTAHGFADGVEPAGINFIEVMGSYLVARCFIRSADHFRRIVRMLFISVVIMLPFLVAETITGRHYLNMLLSQFGPTITPHFMEPRLGLERAFGVFDHPILLGVYCISIFSLTYYVLGYGSHRFVALLRTGLVSLGMACSMSAGPLLAAVTQSLIMGWDHLTRWMRKRWLVLGGLAVSMYIAIDLLSNRTPFNVIVDYLTFNTGSAYNRILIWKYGTAEVARHPLLGIGQNEWRHADWMSGSMDNFWLVLAVQGGLPNLLLFAGGVTALAVAVGRLHLTDPRLIAYRRGWMTTIEGLAIAGATVHYWKAMLCLLAFLIGSIAWMLDQRKRAVASRAPRRPQVRRSVPGTIQFG